MWKLEDFGAVSGANCSAALQAALSSGERVTGKPGSRYLFDAALSVTDTPVALECATLVSLNGAGVSLSYSIPQTVALRGVSLRNRTRTGEALKITHSESLCISARHEDLVTLDAVNVLPDDQAQHGWPTGIRLVSVNNPDFRGCNVAGGKLTGGVPIPGSVGVRVEAQGSTDATRIDLSGLRVSHVEDGISVGSALGSNAGIEGITGEGLLIAQVIRGLVADGKGLGTNRQPHIALTNSHINARIAPFDLTNFYDVMIQNCNLYRQHTFPGSDNWYGIKATSVGHMLFANNSSPGNPANPATGLEYAGLIDQCRDVRIVGNDFYRMDGGFQIVPASNQTTGPIYVFHNRITNAVDTSLPSVVGSVPTGVFLSPP